MSLLSSLHNKLLCNELNSDILCVCFNKYITADTQNYDNWTWHWKCTRLCQLMLIPNIIPTGSLQKLILPQASMQNSNPYVTVLRHPEKCESRHGRCKKTFSNKTGWSHKWRCWTSEHWQQNSAVPIDWDASDSCHSLPTHNHSFIYCRTWTLTTCSQTTRLISTPTLPPVIPGQWIYN